MKWEGTSTLKTHITKIALLVVALMWNFLLRLFVKESFSSIKILIQLIFCNNISLKCAP